MNTDAILSNNKVTSLYASVVLHFSSLLKHFDIKALKTTIRAGDSRNDGAFESNTFLCNIKNSRPSEVIPDLLFSLEDYPIDRMLQVGSQRSEQPENVNVKPIIRGLKNYTFDWGQV